MTTIAQNIDQVRERIARAARKAGVDAAAIRLVAVSKTMPVEHIEEAIDAGITEIGENRVQEAEEKYPRIGHRVRWHLVGHLQTNKVKPAVRIFDMIHSVDSLHLGEALHRRGLEAGRRLPALVQVKTSPEMTKAGVEPDRALELVEQLAALSSLAVQGLMTIPAFSPDPEAARPAFRLLRQLRERIEAARIPGVEMHSLSMGMTHDFELAIEEGATIVRIGTAIFGARHGTG